MQCGGAAQLGSPGISAAWKNQYMWYKVIKLCSHTQLSIYRKCQLYFQLHVSAHIEPSSG
jgi:hypothetical protein